MPENAYSLWLYTILVARIILINRPADNPRMGIARRDLDALLLTAKFSFFFFFVEAWFSLRVVRFRTNVSCYSIFRFSISISQPALENEETSQAHREITIGGGSGSTMITILSRLSHGIFIARSFEWKSWARSLHEVQLPTSLEFLRGPRRELRA